MKLKNIIRNIVCGLFIFGASSCSDFLEIEPLNEIVLDKFWNEKSDVENVIASCYSSMQSQTVIDRMMAWGEFRSDNIIGGTNVEDDASLANIFKENINASNAYTTWGEFYYIINTCNTVIYYAPQVAEKDPSYTQSDLMAHIAEVSAIRDLMYFYLIRAFRDVPYTTTPYLDDTQEMAVAATPFNAVLDSLITDLESVQSYAVKKYPTTKTYYQHGRITQDAIHAMLADMYLWKQDYDNAIKYADMVIDAKTEDFQNEIDQKAGNSSVYKMFEGYPLIDDKSTLGNFYGNAYDAIFGNGNSRESIFELIYMDNNNMLSNAAVSYRYGNSATRIGYVRCADFLGQDVSQELFNKFKDKYDCRAYENISGSASPFGIAKYSYKTATVSAGSSTISSILGEQYPEKYCHANWIIYRLTDVMLMKAEALVQKIDANNDNADYKAERDSLLNGAYQIVNIIEKRSSCASTYTDVNYNSYSSKNLMENLVMDERQKELMFEGKRWFDLVRRSRRDGNTDYMTSCVTQKSSDNSSVIQAKLAKMDAIYWPYYIDELKVNPYLVQNSAFSSGENSSYKSTTK